MARRNVPGFLTASSWILRCFRPSTKRSLTSLDRQEAFLEGGVLSLSVPACPCQRWAWLPSQLVSTPATDHPPYISAGLPTSHRQIVTNPMVVSQGLATIERSLAVVMLHANLCLSSLPLVQCRLLPWTLLPSVTPDSPLLSWATFTAPRPLPGPPATQPSTASQP